MAMEIMNNYSSYMAQNTAGNSTVEGTQKKDTEKTDKKANKANSSNSKSESTTSYINKLKKLAPSVEFKVGNAFSSAKSGKTLTINPKILEKMQNDPEKEKEMKELIKGVESMTRLSESINKSMGWKVVYRHSYIDENGQYRHVAYIRNEHGYKMSEKLREERRKNAEKLIEKQKEKVEKKKEKIEEMIEEKKEVKEEVKEERKSGRNKIEQLINEKIADSKDGIVYVDNEDIKVIIEAAKEDNTSVADAGRQSTVGMNLDLQV